MRLFIADCCMLTAILMTVAFFAGLTGLEKIRLDPRIKFTEAVYKQNAEYVAAHPWLAKHLRKVKK